MKGGEAEMKPSVLTIVDVGLIGRDIEVAASSVAIQEDTRGFVHADLDETTDGVKEVGVDPDFDEVRGVIGVFPVSHLKKKKN